MKNMKWLIGGVAAVALAGGLYLANPMGQAVAAGTPWGGMNPGMMAQMMGGQHMAMMAGSFDDMKVMHTEMMAELAGKLGLTAGDLEKQLAEGKTISELAKDKGVDAAELKTLAREKAAARLTQLVAEGKLTQAQADQMVGMMTADHMEMMLNMPMTGMMGSGGCHSTPAQ